MRDDFDFRFAGPGRYGDNFYNQFYLDENKLYHREDGPAIIDSDGNKFWFWRDKQHRDGDLPAVEMKDGTRGWFHHGKQHREGGPAVIHPDGREEWWLNGKQLDEDAVKIQKRLLLQKQWQEQAQDIDRDFHRGLDHTVKPMKPCTVTRRSP